MRTVSRRSILPAVVAVLGVLSLLVPGVVGTALSTLPGVDIADGWLLQAWGAAYLAVGVGTAWFVWREQVVTRPRIVAVAGLAVVAMAGRFVGVAGGLERFLPLTAVLIPFAVGTARSNRERAWAIGFLVVPVGGGALALEPAFAMASPRVLVSAVFSLYGLVGGLPLAAAGAAWRGGVDPADRGDAGGRGERTALNRQRAN